jgi:topoisomerase IV subunit A
VRVADKSFIGKDIVHVGVFQKNDERTTYNMIYSDGKTGVSYAKRFNVSGVTREKEYDLAKNEEKSKVNYLSVNGNGEAEIVRVILSPNCTARIKEFDFDFGTLEIKGRTSIGNQVTKYPIKSVKFKEAGKSTLSGRKLWFDDTFGRLNTDQKGQYLGSFEAEEKIIVFYSDGTYEITDQELTQRLEADKTMRIEKFDPEKIVTAVYLDKEKLHYNIKRFKIETTTLHNKFSFIKEGEGNELRAVTTVSEPILIVQSGRGSQVRSAKFKVVKMAEVMGWKAVGTKLVDYTKTVVMEWEKKKNDSSQPELFE